MQLKRCQEHAKPAGGDISHVGQSEAWKKASSRGPKTEEEGKVSVTATAHQGDRGRGESFVWTDNEVEFLLNITLEYKVGKTQESQSLANPSTLIF